MTLLIKEIPTATEQHTPTEFVSMTWDERRHTHRKYMTDKGNEVALALPRGTTLTDGMIIYTDQESIIAVRAQPEPVIVIRPVDQAQACIAAHNLGNWHRSMQVTADGEMLAEEDAPLKEWLSKTGIPFAVENRVFQPTVAVTAHD
jgi:urease accessory protein